MHHKQEQKRDWEEQGGELLLGDQQGLIGFREWVFISTLLAIPSGDADVGFRIFDSNNSGFIDIEEFEAVVDSVCSKYIPKGRYSRREVLFPRLIESLFGDRDEREVEVMSM